MRQFRRLAASPEAGSYRPCGLSARVGAVSSPDWYILCTHETMPRILLFFLIAIPAWSLAQTYVYDDQRMFYSDIIYTVNGGHITEGNSIMWNDAILTVHNGKIFQGFSTSTFDLLMSSDQKHIYEGDSQFSFDILYTIENGTIYPGDTTFPMDALYTYSNGVIYKGKSTFFSDAVLWLQGPPLCMTEVVALLMVAGLI
jgi:hypothetical protein